MRKFSLLAATLLALLIPAAAIPQPAAQQVVIAGQMAYGLGWNATTVLLNYTEPSQTTCTIQNSVVIKVPANTTNQTINLATLFPGITTAVAYSMQDITTTPGQQVNWGLASGGQRFSMAPMGMMIMRVNGSSPTIYVDDPSTTTAAYLQVSALGN